MCVCVFMNEEFVYMCRREEVRRDAEKERERERERERRERMRTRISIKGIVSPYKLNLLLF